MSPLPLRHPEAVAETITRPEYRLFARKFVEVTSEVISKAPNPFSELSLTESLWEVAKHHPLGSAVLGMGVITLMFRHELYRRLFAREPQKPPEVICAELIAHLEGRYSELVYCDARISRIKTRLQVIEKSFPPEVIEKLTQGLSFINDEQLERAWKHCENTYNITLGLFKDKQLGVEDLISKVEFFDEELNALKDDVQDSSTSTSRMDEEAEKIMRQSQQTFDNDELRR